MKTCRYDEIAIGHTDAFQATIGLDEMVLFEKLTGDRNPLHTQKKVCYGLLTSSFLSTLAGMYVPGERALIHGVDVEFPRPLVVSEDRTITVKGVVVEKSDAFKLLTIKVTITDDSGEKILRGKMKVGVRDE